ncbi:immunoglobulin-like domain-containing protein [Chryseomicrobium palamuruense]|uniref:Immunoglobulin-like domain-containing protein n=1 Tax=Chryseomicrobium palamuruense TaxID=682973 RepID=A0ABV8V0U2_9BACL
MKNIFVSLFVLIALSGCTQNTSSKEGSWSESPYNQELPQEVKQEQMDVSISLNEDEFSLPVEELLVTLTNRGDVAIGYGGALYVEKLVDGEWLEIPLNRYAYTDDLVELRVGEEITQDVPVERVDGGFQKGTYRIRKSVSVDMNTYPLAVEFEVR